MDFPKKKGAEVRQSPTSIRVPLTRRRDEDDVAAYENAYAAQCSSNAPQILLDVSKPLPDKIPDPRRDGAGTRVLPVWDIC